MSAIGTLRRIDFSQYIRDHRVSEVFFIDLPPEKVDYTANRVTYRIRKGDVLEAVREAYACLSQLTEDELYELEDRRLVHLSTAGSGLIEVRHALEAVDEKGETEIDGYCMELLVRTLDDFIQVRHYASRN